MWILCQLVTGSVDRIKRLVGGTKVSFDGTIPTNSFRNNNFDSPEYYQGLPSLVQHFMKPYAQIDHISGITILTIMKVVPSNLALMRQRTVMKRGKLFATHVVANILASFQIEEYIFEGNQKRSI
ncbi:uncharacterized protein [Rutidosis leptorrhynchoides]|uniref:uncharacterized protein isoform X2 n=1 Tax=Rutidosis leptorrhynchoides TaxID=125765 RepID=UPI003A98F35E